MKENKELIPKRRFKEFENSDAWELRKLGEIASKIGSGKTPLGGEKAYKDYGVCLIRSQNVNYGTINFCDVVYIDDETDEEMKNSRVLKGDVLLNITGASIGRSAVYHSFERANVNQHVCIIRPLSCKISPEFIHLNLTSNNGQKQIDSSQAGGAREGLNFQQISKMVFLFPKIREQTQIGTFFSNLDKLITFHQRKLKKTKKLKKAYLSEMFPKEGEKYPRLRFVGYTDAWGQCKLGEVADVTKLAGFEFTQYVIYSDKGSVIALRGLNVKNGNIILNDVKYIDKSDFPKLSRSKLYKNDILLTYVGTVGELAVISEDNKYYLAPNVARIRINNNINSQFIIQQMGSKRFYEKIIFPLIATSSQPALSMENVRKFDLMLPSPEEQYKIGTFFIEIDKLITLHQRKLEKLENIKKAYLNEMFI